jgi:uncharacterized membrane protein
MDPKLKVIVSFIVPSVVFIVIAIPLIIGKVPRNWAYGFRTKKTLSNDEIWYKANKFGGVSLLAAGLVTLTGCLVLFLNRNSLTFDTINSVGFGLFVGPLIVSVILSLLYIKKL